MSGGRPRIVRKKEYCPCCGNTGYTRHVKSWTPGYEETTKNVYRRFSHDDRNYICNKCDKKECYVEQILRDRENTNLPKHPLKEIIVQVETMGNQIIRASKTYGRFTRSMKSWPLTKDESRRFLEALQLAQDLQELIDRALEIYETIMIDYLMKGKNVPSYLIHELYSVMPAAGTNDDPDLYVRLVLEPLRRQIKELDQKYGIPQRKKQKQDKIRNIKKSLDKVPKRTLPS